MLACVFEREREREDSHMHTTLSLSLSLSLSLTHTRTHTHTLSLSLSHTWQVLGLLLRRDAGPSVLKESITISRQKKNLKSSLIVVLYRFCNVPGY